MTPGKGNSYKVKLVSSSFQAAKEQVDRGLPSNPAARGSLNSGEAAGAFSRGGSLPLPRALSLRVPQAREALPDLVENGGVVDGGGDRVRLPVGYLLHGPPEDLP